MGLRLEDELQWDSGKEAGLEGEEGLSMCVKRECVRERDEEKGEGGRA